MSGSSPNKRPPLQQQSYRTPVHSTSSNSSRSGDSQNVSSLSRLWQSASSSSGGSGIRFKRTPRPNPFDSHLSTDRLKLPILSPSMFSTIQSPSQDRDTSGKFWSLEQQAQLFPAEISDDSPWKQETATSVLDQDTENRTQEAIDLYFSRNHEIKSPDDNLVPSLRPPLACSSLDLGSPMLVASASRRSSYSGGATANSGAVAGVKVSQWTQTLLTLPPILPPEIEKIFSQYTRFHERQDQQPKEPVQPADEQGNLSTSTLRRKLFEGMIEDSSDDEDDQDPRSEAKDIKDEEEGTEKVPDHLMSSPIRKDDLFSPEQFPITPISKMARYNAKNPTWSSSPISTKTSRRTSMTPPEHLRSPTFSPICRTGTKSLPCPSSEDDGNKENEPKKLD